MATVEIGEMLNAIGQHTANVLGKTPKNVFVYLRAGDQWMEGSIFDDLGTEVIYHDPNEEMVYEVIRLWDAANPDRKWEMLHYDIKDGEFTVKYFYPDDLDPEEDSPEQRERALAERYGDKPIIYPEPASGNWHELTEEELAAIDASENDPDDG